MIVDNTQEFILVTPHLMRGQAFIQHKGNGQKSLAPCQARGDEKEECLPIERSTIEV
jgi:hypothetical protein